MMRTQLRRRKRSPAQSQKKRKKSVKLKIMMTVRQKRPAVGRQLRRKVRLLQQLRPMAFQK